MEEIFRVAIPHGYVQSPRTLTAWSPAGQRMGMRPCRSSRALGGYTRREEIFSWTKSVPVIQEAAQKSLYFNKTFPWENFEDERRVTFISSGPCFICMKPVLRTEPETSTERPDWNKTIRFPSPIKISVQHLAYFCFLMEHQFTLIICKANFICKYWFLFWYSRGLPWNGVILLLAVRVIDYIFS